MTGARPPVSWPETQELPVLLKAECITQPRTVIDLAERWAAKINGAQGDAVQAIIAVGRLLVSAKAELQHGEWERMFTGHVDAVQHPIAFSSRTARMLMAVAENPTLSNRKHVSDLPPSWGTLYELTKLDAPILTQAIADGKIHPDMERKEARALQVPDETTAQDVCPVVNSKKESDWDCSLVLTVRHSKLPAVKRSLRDMGFTGGGGTSRKMRLSRDARMQETS